MGPLPDMNLSSTIGQTLNAAFGAVNYNSNPNSQAAPPLSGSAVGLAAALVVGVGLALLLPGRKGK